MDPDAKAAPAHPPVWKIWANPIVRRYARSRLRPRGMGVWLLLTLLVAGFFFFMTRAVGHYQMEMAQADVERLPLIPLLILQGVILFLLATGQAAGGMTGERDEGVIEYQRLAPMTPLAKVVGYLFGLPIREYVLFLATMPFTLWCLWRGQVPFAIGVQIYGIFLVSAVLYHLTGILAGTVIKNRRWAFLASMGLIFMLYTVMPQASKLGLVYFKYVTIYPVVEESLPFITPRDVGAAIETVQRLVPMARFFNLNLPQAVFTAISQGVFIFVMLVMLWRHWSRSDSHLLGKAGATALFAWIQLVVIGNAIPLIEPGALFPSQELNRYMFFNDPDYSWRPNPTETLAMVGAYGLVTLVTLWMMILLITPKTDGQIRGWRRARKLGRKSLSPFSDPATSAPWVGLMVLLGAGGWFWFSKEIVGSHWFGGEAMPLTALGAYLVVMAAGGFGFQAILEGKGGRAAGLAVILIGILPVMVGMIVGASSDELGAPATWLIGMSPLMGAVYAAATVLPVAELPTDLTRSVPRAFWFWQAVALVVAARNLGLLWKVRRKIATESIDEDVTSSLDSGPSSPGL